MINYKEAYRTLNKAYKALLMERIGTANTPFLIEWINDEKRGKAITSFTDGPERQIAYDVEAAIKNVAETCPGFTTKPIHLCPRCGYGTVDAEAKIRDRALEEVAKICDESGLQPAIAKRIRTLKSIHNSGENMSVWQIELAIRVGYETHVVAVKVSEDLVRELSEPMELSNDPLSLFLSGAHIGGYIEMRRKKFRMREDYAKEISAAITSALIEYFGRNDITNGYTKKELSPKGRT